ncbi:hypothetical protein G1C98_1263 [Bifidobacterium sp. DSM 109960]|uniref:Uncharacterized protein n=1 Tax=Bifidobacterium erythrocebi TaxID=2675325 RepID=A0A7Y0HVR6_9BIFI|nr:hypothetical protein [Bifidobacterium sp. DSM 109960]
MTFDDEPKAMICRFHADSMNTKNTFCETTA